MATVGIQKGLQLVHGEGQTMTQPETAAQTFKVGDPLVLDGAGRIKLAVESGSTPFVALEDASGTTDNEVLVMMVEEGQIWSINLSNAGAADDYELTMAGDNYGFIKSTQTGETAKTTLDFNDTSNEVLQLVRVDPRSAVGDTNALLWVKFVAAKIVLE